MNRAVLKASNPLTYKDRKNWERVLTLACSLVKKDRKKEEWNVALDKNQKDRNYLYGRLLAVADRIEYRTYDDGDKARFTNAKRYMSTFSQRPFETWKVIEENIQPYMNKLGIAERRFYENLLNDIYELFEIDSLNGVYNYLISMFNFKNIIVDDVFLYYLIPNITLIIFAIIASTPIIKIILDRYKYIRIITLIFGMILSTSFLVDASFNPFLYFRF